MSPRPYPQTPLKMSSIGCGNNSFKKVESTMHQYSDYKNSTQGSRKKSSLIAIIYIQESLSKWEGKMTAQETQENQLFGHFCYYALNSDSPGNVCQIF